MRKDRLRNQQAVSRLETADLEKKSLVETYNTYLCWTG